ncbi:MAG: (2Fe-2S) ferredoxin domain-containing protein [Cyanobacteria bacterium P01_E01_bin.34]
MAETRLALDSSPAKSATQLPPFKWHLLLCADQTKPKCCSTAVGLEAWTYLKKRIKELGLDSGSNQVHRTKANCLRGCDYCVPGPVMVVYPGGFWYRSATPEAIERILQDHILAGSPVEALLVGQVPLQTSDVPNTLDELYVEPPTEPMAIGDPE